MGKRIFYQSDSYDKQQVDEYISWLSAAYKTLYDEFYELNCKYNKLHEEFKIISDEKWTGSGIEIDLDNIVTTAGG